MRQTSKRARRSRLLMIFILVLLIALVLWGLAALADRLLHYGANATVSAKDADQPSAITPTPETADDTPKNTYDPACFYRDGEFLRYESSTVTSQIGIGQADVCLDIQNIIGIHILQCVVSLNQEQVDLVISCCISLL